MSAKQRLLIAVGGNAIHPGNITGTADEQLALAAQTGRALLPIMRSQQDNELIITHGNLGQELLNTAQAIVGNQQGVFILSLSANAYDDNDGNIQSYDLDNNNVSFFLH